MGIALLALSDLFSPLQSLAHRWMAPRRRPAQRRVDDVEIPRDLRYVQVRPGPTPNPGTRPAETASATRPSRTLRVIRVSEGGRSPANTRLLLSGRMEDVCAELDRLSALEAAQAPGSSQLH